MLSVEGGIAEVAWHKSGRREAAEVGELTDFVVKDWDREHWSLD